MASNAPQQRQTTGSALVCAQCAVDWSHVPLGCLILNGLFKRHRRQLAANALIPLGLLSLWLMYNHSVSGHILPATFALKGQTHSGIRPENIESFGRYFWQHLGPVGLFCIGLGLTQLRPKNPKFIWALYVIGLVGVMSITHTVSHSEYFYWSRYLHPILPIGVLLSAPLVASKVRTLLLLWLGWNLYTLPSAHQMFVDNVDDIHHMDTLVGIELQTQENDGWIASTNAGSVRFHSNRPVIDILGLNSHQLAYAEDSSQALLKLLEEKEVEPASFASRFCPTGRFSQPRLIKVAERPELNLCDCPSQKTLGIFQKKPIH